MATIAFYAVFDSGLPAGSRYGSMNDGSNRWVGRRIALTPENVAGWKAGEDLKFYDYNDYMLVESSLFRVVEEVKTVTITENNLSR